MNSSYFKDLVRRDTRTATYNATGLSETWTQGESLWASVIVVNRSRSVDYQQTYSNQKIYKVTLRGRSDYDVKNTRFVWTTNGNKVLEPYLVVYDSSQSDTPFSIYYCHLIQ